MTEYLHGFRHCLYAAGETAEAKVGSSSGQDEEIYMIGQLSITSLDLEIKCWLCWPLLVLHSRPDGPLLSESGSERANERAFLVGTIALGSHVGVGETGEAGGIASLDRE